MSQKKSSQGAMGQKLTSERDSSNKSKSCYICKAASDKLLECVSCGKYCDPVCAWVDAQELPTVWKCAECKSKTQLSPAPDMGMGMDMDTDSTSESSVDSVIIMKGSTKKATSTPSPLKVSDKAAQKSEITTRKAVSKRPLDTPKPPSPPLVVIKSSKKKSESGSPSKRQKKSNSSKQPVKDMETQTVTSSEMQLLSANKPDELQTALHTIQSHLDQVHVLRARNAGLTAENKTLKERANNEEETSWQLKEYNENLEAQVKELKAERDELQDKLHKIRRLSGIAMLDNDDA